MSQSETEKSQQVFSLYCELYPKLNEYAFKIIFIFQYTALLMQTIVSNHKVQYGEMYWEWSWQGSVSKVVCCDLLYKTIMLACK